MIITVKILRGRECTIEAPGTSSVSFIKQLVARELDIPVDQQRLLFRGKTLSDSLCLGDYNIVDGTKLHLLVRKTESDEESSTFWVELERTLCRHFSKEDANRVLEEMKKDVSKLVQNSSLDDIERYAQSRMQNGTCQKAKQEVEQQQQQQLPSSSRPSS